MWLIDTSSLQLQSISESALLEEKTGYAILSHRWREDEVDFSDMTTGVAINKKGYAKIQGLCRIAKSENCQHAWIDTCCINKTNQEELSEAINSMYRWYSNATICVAYLDDVGDDVGPFESSVWFERGWTLQELIAPTHVRFYDQNWTCLGNKNTLTNEISKITQIPPDVLRHQSKVKSCSVAQRMSWAAKRETARLEDRAYSLMGLFGVYMPMIYGEGENAFFRLQTEIIKTVADQSIFAWSLSSEQPFSNLFAISPSQFKACGNVLCAPGSGNFSIENGALKISLIMFPYSMDTYAATLCATENGEPCAILLTRLGTDNNYARVKNSAGKSIVKGTKSNSYLNLTQIYVQNDPDEPQRDTQYGFWLRKLEIPGAMPGSTHILSCDSSPASDRIFVPENSGGTAGIVLTETPTHGWTWSNVRWLKFGFDWDFHPMCLLASRDQPENVALKGLTKRKFDEAANLSSPLRQKCKILDDSSWTTAREGKAPSHTRAWPEGIVTLQGDRRSGLVYRMESLNIKISITLVPDPMSTSTTGGQTNTASRIWAVDITNLGGRPPELGYYSREAGYGVQWVAGVLCACIMCPCPLREMQQRYHEDHA